MARAMVLQWAATASATVRAMGTAVARALAASWLMATRGTCRGHLRLTKGCPWRDPRLPAVTAMMCHEKVKYCASVEIGLACKGNARTGEK